MIIDAHQHFWSIARGDYHWLTPELTPLYRDFLPSDLEPLLDKHTIEGTVLVQAAPTIAETHYLISLAEKHDFIKGVVGWIDFNRPDAARTVAELAANPHLVGLRPMIQDIKDDDWMLQAHLAPAFEAVIENNLIFDALTLPKHLPHLRQLLARYPHLTTIIDHGSKPDIASRQFTNWSKDIELIATTTTAYVKLSGLVTEASDNWTVNDLKPFVDHLLACFGSSRIIWGSDWPVCTLASSYPRWLEATETLLADLDHTERASIMGGNAIDIYNLNGAST